MSNTAYPTSPVLIKIRFWLSFVAGLIAFGYILFLGAFTFRGDITLQMSGFVLALIIAFSWLIWRWVIWGDRLPRIGLEWPVGLGLLVAVLSLLASPDWRQGVSRVGWLFGYVLIFYLFVNLLNSDLDRWGTLLAATTIAGLVVFQAVAETWQWYRNWWDVSGSLTLPDVIYRFRGLLTSCIPLMALAILFVPFLLVCVWRLRRPLPRVLAGVWLVFYAIAVPFSSSRSAWVGLFVAIVVGGAFWAREKRIWQIIRSWPRRRMILLGVGLVIGLAIATVAIITFIKIFAAHPGHGGDPFGSNGRNVFWAHAVEIWQTSPWLGTGPGRFAFEYLRFESYFPPVFWPVHAHSVFFQSLAEFGLTGLITWLIFLAALARWGWQRYQQTPSADQPWTAAILAGLTGLLAQLFFDDLTIWMAVMVPAIFLLAWIETGTEPATPTFRRVSLGWLALPIFGLLAVVGWGIWAYQPFSRWTESAMNGDWRQAAELSSESARRDPYFHFYQTESGLLWAWKWKYSNDPAGLEKARHYLKVSLQLEPSLSWNWANLAVLDAAAGDLPLAIERMERAVKLSPQMGAYLWNLGKFYEETGKNEPALTAYRNALDLKPDWVKLSFWSETPLRRAALASWVPGKIPGLPEGRLSQMAREQIAAGRLDGVERLLDQARLMEESEFNLLQIEILLADARGDPAASRQTRERLHQAIVLDQMMLNVEATFSYSSFISERNGVGFSAVPGLVPEMPVPPMP